MGHEFQVSPTDALIKLITCTERVAHVISGSATQMVYLTTNKTGWYLQTYGNNRGMLTSK